MKRLFLDTNILLDIVLARDPFCEPAQILWTLSEKKKLHAGVSAISVSNVFFIVKKLASATKAYEAIEVIQEIFNIIPATSVLLKKATRAGWPDFEDAVQHLSALDFKAQALITRDPAGFKKSRLPIMTAAEYLAAHENL